jgi:hypothetical protein
MRRVVCALIVVALMSVGMVRPSGIVAQDATPVPTDPFPITADPALCTGERAAVEDLLGLWFDAEGTPAATDAMGSPVAMDGMEAMNEVTLPLGEPAGAAITAEITTVVQNVFSCFAAGDPLVSYGLFSENLQRMFGPEPGTTREEAEFFLTQEAQPDDELGDIVAITDVMLLEDGRVGAFIVDRYLGQYSTSYVIFVQEDGRWLVDDVIGFTEDEEEMDEASTDDGTPDDPAMDDAAEATPTS